MDEDYISMEEDYKVRMMRVIPNVDVAKVLLVLARQWNISSPDIVLFVVSNTATRTNWRVDNFVKGLVRAANTTDMWICTNGSNMGVVKAIGTAFGIEAVKEKARYYAKHNDHGAFQSKFTLLGISREEILSNAEKLKEEGRDGPPGHHGPSGPKGDQILSSSNDDLVEHHKYDLNLSHNYCIIVKSNDKKKYNNFLSNFECHLAQTIESESLGNEDIPELVTSEIPVVAILIQGGVSCVDFILDHLKNSLPVIVIEGSGGLADLIAYTYYEIDRRPLGIDDTEYVENILKPELYSKICHDFEDHNYLQRLSIFNKILECMEYSRKNESEYLTIVNAFDPNLEDLSLYLLRALMKSQKPNTTNWIFQMEKDLYLAMDWNKPDMAEREVFFKDCTNRFKISDEVFEAALLRPKREEFVSLFLKQGFKVHQYLKSSKLVHLFQHSREQGFFDVVCCQGVLGYGRGTKITTDFLDHELNWLIEELVTLPCFVSSQELDLEQNVLYEDRAAAAERKATTILIIWAILSNRVALAKQLWMHSEHPIQVALINSMMLHKLQFFVSQIGKKEEMENQSREFGKMATEVLDAWYAEMPCRADDFLCEEQSEFAYRTVVELAALAENRPFIAHPCCQKWLDGMFMGNIRIRTLTWGVITFPTWLKVILSAMLVFPIYLWVQFRENEEYVEYLEQDSDKSDDDSEVSVRNFSLPNIEENHLVDNSRRIERPVCEWRVKSKFLPLYEKVFRLWSAPITKFWIFQIFYIVYLLLFSLAVLWPSCGNRNLDIAVCTWTTLILVESVHRTYVLFKKFYSMPMVLKCVEILLLVVFIFVYAMDRIAGYGMFFGPYGDKILLCCALIYMFYRFIVIVFPISPELGPQLYRIQHMVFKDFASFMKFALIIMISNAIVLQSVIYPDFLFSGEMFRRVFDRAWTSLFLTPADDFGEVNPNCVQWIRKSEGSEVCVAAKYLKNTCPNPSIWPYLLGIQFFIFLKLILITMLYALFINSQSNVLDDSDVLWKFQRYQLIVDFAHRQHLPAPFNLFIYLVSTVQCLIKWCCRRDKPTEFRKEYNYGRQYNYWRQLAYKVGKNQEMKEKEEDVLRKRLETLQKLAEDLTFERKTIYSHVTHLSEIQNYLESFKLDEASDQE